MIVLLTLCCIAGLSTTVVDSADSKRSIPSLVSRPLIVSDKAQPLPLPREIVEGVAITLPRPKDLNRNKLTRRLDSEFDPRWMSIDVPDPDASPEAGEDWAAGGGPTGTSATQAWLLNELRNLNLSSASAGPGNNALSSSTRAALEAWLLEKASCPVRHEWVNIGPLFWPPWVKHGTCVARQCSWPSGMKCVPGETNTVTLLRWHCMSAAHEEEDTGRSSRKRNKCRWLKVPYPVISECVCTCGRET